MRSFYQFLMTFRGKKQPDDQSYLADWVFFDHGFPKYSNDYDEISSYLEWNSPFSNALIVFDEIWELYNLSNE
ncbi:YozE family protein [Virgibacillus natechei]|uniref:YozE family protein n=1 Tax=Virgibacillus natechei TaxID=1216297 RepID=UPI001AE8AA2A|nr:YozE family protein [Virgibacillus natechei]UZD14787.1 YozE family protein [Virgibacillus natechei]